LRLKLKEITDAETFAKVWRDDSKENTLPQNSFGIYL